MNIILPCRSCDNLDWQIDPAISGPIVWEFDLGLADPYFPIDDELRFSSLKLALFHFTNTIWPFYGERTKKAILYRGSADFSAHYFWSETQKENWNLWKQEQVADGSEEHLRRTFCIDMFAQYFRMLSHALPDELPLSLCFETAGCGSRAEIGQLLSKKRFEYFDLISEVSSATCAVCMPEEHLCNRFILEKLDRLFASLQEPYRMIEEAVLTQSWEGLERIYVISEAVTVQGKRKLMGFCAAGGLVIVEGESLGLSNEIPLKQ
ncbi:MAG TPA: hypothetical protein VLE95_08710 [Chlamydiales bacterium]|nr:hypothetical protein [Chlamydiales bacterium]